LHALFARLSERHTFRLLSTSHQFELLRAEVALEHPARDAAMDEWTPAVKDGLLLHLANTVEQSPPTDTIELRRVTKRSSRETSLGTRYLPTGIDLRLFEGNDFRRTQLCRDAPAVESLYDEWLAASIERGWQPVNTTDR
jgi:hypothetical protein